MREIRSGVIRMEIGETKDLEWDRSSGEPPKKGQIIENLFDERFKVISRKGNKITIEFIGVKGV
jgi:hypothetical protein